MRLLTISFITLISYSFVPAQETTFQDSLLDKMTGEWLLTGTIAGQHTTHDVNIEWVLGHQYIQIHEISREKDSVDKPAYEAIVYIGSDTEGQNYACLWLDITSGKGLNGKFLGHAPKKENSIPFLFNIEGVPFHTTFVYNNSSGSWQWIMDGEDKGKPVPFARLILTRK